MKPTPSQARLVQSLATVSGALAATVAATQAATVQITLTGNKLTTSISALNADVTNDNVNDMIITGVFQDNSGLDRGIRFNINGQALAARYVPVPDSTSFFVDARFIGGGVGVGSLVNMNLQNASYLNPISFTDARINGGAPTQGYLQINAFNSSKTDHTVALTRLVFDNASTTLGTSGLSTSATYTEFVPEPSSFALLALGAGGLLARRRRPAA